MFSKKLRTAYQHCKIKGWRIFALKIVYVEFLARTVQAGFEDDAAGLVCKYNQQITLGSTVVHSTPSSHTEYSTTVYTVYLGIRVVKGFQTLLLLRY